MWQTRCHEAMTSPYLCCAQKAPNRAGVNCQCRRASGGTPLSQGERAAAAAAPLLGPRLRPSCAAPTASSAASPASLLQQPPAGSQARRLPGLIWQPFHNSHAHVLKHCEFAVMGGQQYAACPCAGLPEGQGRLLGALHSTLGAGSAQHAPGPAPAAAGKKSSLMDDLCRSLAGGPAPPLPSRSAPSATLPGLSGPLCRY
jgi:hypothetical protein